MFTETKVKRVTTSIRYETRCAKALRFRLGSSLKVNRFTLTKGAKGRNAGLRMFHAGLFTILTSWLTIYFRVSCKSKRTNIDVHLKSVSVHKTITILNWVLKTVR